MRWFKSPNIVALLKWHAMHKSADDLVRHITYSKAWKHFTTTMGEFGRRAKDMVIGLSMDGFDPFATKLCKWSTWLVFAFVYNFLPWVTTK